MTSVSWLDKTSLVHVPSQQQQCDLHPPTKGPLWKPWNLAAFAKKAGRKLTPPPRALENRHIDLCPRSGPCREQAPVLLGRDGEPLENTVIGNQLRTRESLWKSSFQHENSSTPPEQNSMSVGALERVKGAV